MQKTIAIFINTSWNIYNFRSGLLNALQKKGYHIVAVAPRDSYVEKLEAMGIEYQEIKLNNKGINPFEDAKLTYDIYRLYKKISPDIVLHYTIKPNIYGSIAAGVLGIPVISNISGLGTVFLNDRFSSKIARLLYRIALRFPHKIFFQNQDDRALFVANKLVKIKKTDLLPGSGIDTKKFKPVEQTVAEENRKVHFLLIARLLKDKGVVEYVEAARKFVGNSSVEFSILGAYYPGNPTAITPEQMQQWEAEKIITYLGEREDVISVIADSDCVVLPSYREGLSRVLLEAASMAKPIIATNVPGCREVVDDGINGYLCEPKDVPSLVRQMEKMIQLPLEARKMMGIKGREKVKREFDENLVIQRYTQAIEEILR
jgi:glycosyltransferase involved in cell wall biosynthesis